MAGLPGRRSAASTSMAAMVLGLTLVAVSTPALAASAGEAAVVRISREVSPRELVVPPGTAVVFRNDDTERHRMRSRGGPVGFDTGDIEPGEAAVVVLRDTGDYPYVDERDRAASAYHGSVVVSPDAPAASTLPDATEPVPSEATVGMAGRTFSPAQTRIAAGGSVTFRNDDDRDHTATGDSFDSGVLSPGSAFNQVFPEPGTFSYMCLIHPDMRGTVEVVAEPAASPGPSASPAPDQLPGDAPAAVQLIDFEMSPALLSVAAGTKVDFSNAGRAPHSATHREGTFDSGILAPGGTFSHVFDTPGVFEFFCLVHPTMVGRIEVQEVLSP